MADTDKNDLSPRPSGGSSFFTILIDLLLGRESDPQRRELQASQRQLNKTGNKFFKMSKDRLLPPFASFLYGVYEAVDPLREFFLTDTSDAYYARAVISYFKNDKIVSLSDSLSKESLVERGKDKPFPELKEEAHKAFERLTAVVNKDLAGKMNAMYNAVIVLKQFCLIDYYAILKRFKPDFEEHRFGQNVTFGQLLRKFSLDIVPDFISAAVNLLCVEDWTAQLDFLSTLPEFGDFDRQSFDAMHDKLLKLSSLGVFNYLGRLVLHDPSYSIAANFPNNDIVKSYLDNMSNDVESILLEIDTKQKEAVLEQQMREVFDGAEILELQHYNEESSDVLEGLDVDLDEGEELSYTKHAQVKYFHTFVAVYLSKKLLEFIENFSVRADILGSDYTAKFSAEFHQMLAVDDEIMKMDMELGQGFPNGYKIAMLVDAAVRSYDAAEKLYTEISNVNKQFSNQLGTGLGILQVTYKKITDLLEDRKSLSPSIVKNWSSIDEYLREPSLTTLTEAHSRLSHFISLMEGGK